MKEKNKKLIEKQSNKKGARLFEAWKKIGASETLIAVSKRLTRTMMMLLWYGVNGDRGKSHMKRQVGNVYTKNDGSNVSTQAGVGREEKRNV